MQKQNKNWRHRTEAARSRSVPTAFALKAWPLLRQGSRSFKSARARQDGEVVDRSQMQQSSFYIYILCCRFSWGGCIILHIPEKNNSHCPYRAPNVFWEGSLQCIVCTFLVLVFGSLACFIEKNQENSGFPVFFFLEFFPMNVWNRDISCFHTPKQILRRRPLWPSRLRIRKLSKARKVKTRSRSRGSPGKKKSGGAGGWRCFFFWGEGEICEM